MRGSSNRVQASPHEAGLTHKAHSRRRFAVSSPMVRLHDRLRLQVLKKRCDFLAEFPKFVRRLLRRFVAFAIETSQTLHVLMGARTRSQHRILPHLATALRIHGELPNSAPSGIPAPLPVTVDLEITSGSAT